MPSCGSQVILCDLPVHLDTYTGCSHGCSYCFTRRKNDNLSAVQPLNPIPELESFIGGARKSDTNWCDWDIPLHLGAMSDPFQPCESIHQITLKTLKKLAEHRYPFIFSTKGSLVCEPQYLDALSECLVVAQVSIVAPSYDRLEPGAPPFAERMQMVEKLAKVCRRVVVRLQPVFLWAVEDIISTTIPALALAGCHGVTVETFKASGGMTSEPEMVRLGGDHVYKKTVVECALGSIRDAAHAAGMRFYSAENRTRAMGDSLTCCGCDDVPGFKVNRYNLNHLYHGEPPTATEAQDSPGTGDVFAVIDQGAGSHEMCRPVPFARMMDELAKATPLRVSMGLENEDEQIGLFPIGHTTSRSRS